MLQAVFTSGVDEITVHGLTQWDKGQEIQITLSTLPTEFQVHFGYKGCKEAYAVTAKARNGVATAAIPNLILQQSKDAVAWLYVLDDEAGETIKTIFLPIESRPKPSDYVYTEIEVLHYQLLEERLAILEAAGADEARILAAVDEYFEENPEAIGATVEQATQIEQNKSDIALIRDGAVVRNLLDNSDFRNPVNQRGKTIYTGWGYTIDRWQLSNSTLEVVSDGIKLTGNSDAAAIATQYIHDLNDGVYTFAAKVDGAVKTRIIQISGTTVTVIDSSNAEFTGGYITVSYSDNGAWSFNIRANATYSIVAEWAALYEGAYTAETLPAYQPKDYAAELAECQRYYIHIGGDAYSWLPVCKIHGWGSIVAIPANMRIAPTVIARTDGGIVIFNDAAEWIETTLRSTYQRGTTVYIILNDVENTAGGTSYIATGIVGLSADL